MDILNDAYALVIERIGKDIGFSLALFLGALSYIVLRLFLRIAQRLLCFVRSRRRTLNAIARRYTENGPLEGKGLWLTRPIHQPENYQTNLSAAKILAIANLKGGVGKTTIATTVGSCFVHDRGKKVLLVDLDYQGSLSSMAFAENRSWIPDPNQTSIATKAISNDFDPGLLLDCIKNIPGMPGLDLVPAYYDLAQADNRIPIEWLLKCQPPAAEGILQAIGDLAYGKLFRIYDVRYTLAELLHSTALRAAYDLIIIDCPPRLTTGAIQAFCASSHLLIPTILDRPSAEAVISFVEQIEAFKSQGIFPYIHHVGVVGARVPEGSVAARQSRTFLHARFGAMDTEATLLPLDKEFPQAAALVRNPEEGIAYPHICGDQRNQNICNAIRTLTQHIANDMGIPQPIAQPLAAQ